LDSTGEKRGCPLINADAFTAADVSQLPLKLRSGFEIAVHECDRKARQRDRIAEGYHVIEVDGTIDGTTGQNGGAIRVTL
ncbi:hypothetical protein ACCS96_50810, partial [Rhizobium ruizarguesonis]